jgi:hypothetical protein
MVESPGTVLMDGLTLTTRLQEVPAASAAPVHPDTKFRSPLPVPAFVSPKFPVVAASPMFDTTTVRVAVAPFSLTLPKFRDLGLATNTAGPATRA